MDRRLNGCLDLKDKSSPRRVLRLKGEVATYPWVNTDRIKRLSAEDVPEMLLGNKVCWGAGLEKTL
ncbi:hypothetical protein A2U01_0032941 [Trifolium medium]|uniref:Uncharacterized protein n=1 Tax=Trifolium medium TaxID=97028 RepID=A0A392PK16_9FABA|nr:hypothetical protein [Trifolium medium]